MNHYSDINIENVSSTCKKLVRDLHLPGLSVGIVYKDDLIFSEGFGFADIETRKIQNPSLRHRIGSITKTMTGLCAMALVEEGKLSLNERVVDRLPDINIHGHADSLLIRHLMTHTNGIGEAPTMHDYINPWRLFWSNSPNVPKVTESYPHGILVEVKPGTKYAYSNHAFNLLGEIIERVEDKSFDNILKDRIFRPLGMNSTDSYDKPHADLTTGYHHAISHDERDILDLWGLDSPEEDKIDGYNIKGEYSYVKTKASGAVQSSIDDMAIYASMLLREGEGIVNSNTFSFMKKPQWFPHPKLSGIGITFFNKDRYGQYTFYHGGAMVGGWHTQCMIIPEKGLAVLIHMNLWSPDFRSLIDSKILQAVLNAPPKEIFLGQPNVKVLKSAQGVYEPESGHLTNYRMNSELGRVQITEEDGDLILRSRRGSWREGIRLSPFDIDDPYLFAMADKSPELSLLAFEPTINGEISGIRFGQLSYLTKNQTLDPWV